MATDQNRYRSLPVQVAERIVREIRNGTWVSQLPNERALSQTLQVSRKTLHKSILQLQRDGIIRSSIRLGHRIVTRGPSLRRSETAIGLLTPEPLDQLPAHTALWVDELRALLYESGIRLGAFSSSRFFSRSSQDALLRLVRQNPMSCWVLTHSDESMQRWFAEQKIPCVVAGSCHHGIELPNVDFDYFAVCRHAAGAILRRGHRRLMYISQQSRRGGDLDSEAGFLAGVNSTRRDDVSAGVSRHDGSVEGICRMLSRIFDFAAPPTALLVAKPVFYLTAVTFLAERGLRVGRDVSLVSRDHAGYVFSPKVFAKRLFPLVLALARHERIPRLNHRIEPKFVSGPSLGEPPR
jgi:DNA-binding LacI/PurR family transcriptional regulator